MPTPSQAQTKLLTLLRELFQLDQPDLDFGLYRIMHAKGREIEHFLENDLLATIEKAFGGNQAEKIALAQSAYERERQNALDYGGNPDTAPKAQQALAEYKAVQESQGEDAELYDHLYRFFERYYDGGDFLARRYYARETDEKAAPFAVPYDGSEVYLHWANKDQYYIKSAENFRQFTVDIAQAKAGEKQLFDDAAACKLHFTVVDAEEGAHNNVKAASDKERYFILDVDNPIEWRDGELAVRFQYRADPSKTGQAGKWREKCNAKNEQGILATLKDQAQGKDTQAQHAQQFHQALATEIDKGKSGTQTLLAKYLNQYTAKNSMDYFIHKNLGGFLKRELDFYIKNELFRLDDLGTSEAPNSQQYDKLLKKALTLRSVAHKLIEFLAQTEDFQKALWLKKKFVVDTQWLVTLDKVPVSLYPQIKANDDQWAEWVRLGFVGEDADRDALLTSESKLVLDTKFFEIAFTAQLLDYISNESGNLDDATDGVLVHSENFQALNLMQVRYQEEVRCIYIDPPYNTSENGFTYKNQYKHSSWLAMLDQVLKKAHSYVSDEGAILAAIDDTEYSTLKNSLARNFGESNYAGTIAVEVNPAGQNIRPNVPSRSHDYFHIFAKDIENADLVNRELTEEEIASYSFEDVKGKYHWDNLRRRGGNSRPTDRPKQWYPIYRNGSALRVPAMDWDSGEKKYLTIDTLDDGEVAEWPIDPQGGSRIWRTNPKGAKAGIDSGDIQVIQKANRWEISKKSRMPKGKKPKTLWKDGRHSATSYGTKLLIDILGPNFGFSYPKSLHLVSDAISSWISDESLVLDYFGGSGTTGHAVVELNRSDNGTRKYILVEQGEYFDGVTKSRISKVVYSSDWKGGKPTAPETGISQLVKVIRLESYEDTLNNLRMVGDSAQQQIVSDNADLRDAYFLHYLLKLETQGSPSLLNIAQFSDPTAYTLHVKKPGSEAQERRVVDLVETFNWLLGMRVSKLFAPQTFTAGFAEEADEALPVDAQRRMVVKGKMKEVQPSPPPPLPQAGEGSNCWWFRAVTGIAPGSGGREQRVLVVWRKLTGDLARDSLVLEAYLREVHALDLRKPEAAIPFDVLYVNGSHALPAVPQCDIRQTEEAFHRLMWDGQDA